MVLACSRLPPLARPHPAPSHVRHPHPSRVAHGPSRRPPRALRCDPQVVRRAAPLLLPPPPGGEDDTISHCASDGVRMSDISVGWMVLPYFIVGVGECLVAVPLYDVCYSEAPASLRSIAQVQACRDGLSDEAVAELDEMTTLYRDWARKVEEDGWRIATLDQNGDLWFPTDLLANFLPGAECASVLSLRLMGMGASGPLDCGNGIGPIDDAIIGSNDHNGTNTAQAANFMRSATAPEIRAGVIAAKVMRKTNPTTVSPSIPSRKKKSALPMKLSPESPEARE